MFFYLLHISPLWKDLENGKRNVRTFICGTFCYILLHAYMFSAKNKTVKLLRNYIWYIIMADCAAMAASYRIFYGRSILNELSTSHEKDKFDEETHKWIKDEQVPVQSQMQAPIQINKKEIKFENNESDIQFDHDLKKQILENEKKIKENKQKIQNYEDPIINKNTNIVLESPKEEIDKDFYREKIKQVIPKNKKRFNPKKNLAMMEQKHISNKNVHPSEIKQFMKDNHRIKDKNQLEMIDKVMSNYSGVQNMPQDMTQKIINYTNQDMEMELAISNEIKKTNDGTKTSLMCHLPILGTEIGLQ